MYHARCLLLLLLTLASGGCWVGDTPAPQLPVIEASGPGEVSETCDCLQSPPDGIASDGLQGRVYRFTEMVIQDPEALATILNSLWAADLEVNILNLFFRIVTTTPSNLGYPAQRITIEAMSGWRTPDEVLLSGAPVESFCGLPGTEVTLDLEPADECAGKCRVRTAEFGAMNFYAGDEDTPINCGPALEVRHSIPISQVEARFNFDEDCGRLIGGTLTACLEKPKAKGLCVCLRQGGTDACDTSGMVNMGDPPPNATAEEIRDYCRQCGAGMWISLGTLVDQVETPCDPPMGDLGVKISGIFSAEDITPLYSGVCGGGQ
ncbi:hypothetical protein KKF91_02040 [Myxococcota bacterium]|nr:hypothetical protein [Myxococcota bacterium]MBU1429318.1 hypothetical protein [Myxococcota bacterium]MBU1898017.1 hypothetical protein [Myxococcota bacterium]